MLPAGLSPVRGEDITRLFRRRPREESFYDGIGASCLLRPSVGPAIGVRATSVGRLDLDDFRTAAQTIDG